MSNKKIKLYHYSGADFAGKIKTDFFASNSYTLNDLKSCRIRRSFYYLDDRPLEARFKHCRYLYIAEVGAKKIYNLKTDKNGLIDKHSNGARVNIYNLLIEIKKLGYIGILYNTGINIIAVFKDLKISQKIERG